MTIVHPRVHRLLLLATLTLVLSFLAIPRPAFAADVVVGNGTAASCTEAAFSTALNTVQTSGNGLVSFNCGNAPHTITFSGYKQISATVIIDGDDLIIFNGNDNSPFFQVFSSGRLTLMDITLEEGVVGNAAPLENFGSLILQDVILRDNVSSRSAIVNQGDLTIHDSLIQDNRISTGTTRQGGALYSDSGTVRIERTVFVNNVVTPNGATGNGGAIVAFGGSVDISDSRFVDNSAYQGGAIWIQGTSLGIVRTQFNDNRAFGSGGAISCPASGSIEVIRSSFAGNIAGLHGAGIYTLCNLAVTNTTFSGNVASSGGGGGIYDANPSNNAASEVLFSTFLNNEANFGAGIYSDNIGSPDMQISGSVVAFNEGGNCDGVLQSLGYNLTNNTGCGAFTQTGDQINATLPFSPLGSYGGGTLSHLPLPTNEAIDAIPQSACNTLVVEGEIVDQRGVTRPQGTACDSGAVELRPNDLPRQLYLPFVVKP